MKICSGKCARELDESHFNKNKSKLDGLQTFCRDCQKDKAKMYYSTHKEVMRQQIVAKNNERKEKTRAFTRSLKESPCSDCGNKYDWWIMQFDHLDPTIKTADIAKLVGESYGLDRVKEEVDKCEVVCSNCHANRTYLRRIGKLK